MFWLREGWKRHPFVRYEQKIEHLKLKEIRDRRSNCMERSEIKARWALVINIKDESVMLYEICVKDRGSHRVQPIA